MTVAFVISGLQKGFAQDNRVLVESARFSTIETPVILLKWYTKELVIPEGVNLYRKESTSLTWEKLNTVPIRKKQRATPGLLVNDPDLDMFIEIIQKAKPAELQEQMLFFNVLVKSIQSNVLADFMGIYFEDRTVKTGTTYEYKVNRIKGGKEFLLGVSVPVKAGAYEPAAPITDITVAQKEKSIGLNWKHEDNRYYAVNIYRKSNKDSLFVRLNTNPVILSKNPDSLGNLVYPNPMFAEDVKLQEGLSYTYKMTGVGFFGNETAFSDPVAVAFKDITPPPAPENLVGKADSMKARLNWRNVPVQDFSGVVIYRSKRSDGPYNRVNSRALRFDEQAFVDSLTIPGPYYYYVSAVDAAGNEAPSRTVFVEIQDVIPPLQPEGLTMKTDTGRVSLSWKMGSETDLAGYLIYRTIDQHNKKHYVLLNASPLKEDHFEQALPKNVKNKFFYYVVAVDTSYNRSKPSLFVSGAMPDIVAPEKPFIKGVSYEQDNIVLEWIRNVDPDLAGYHIFRSDSADNFNRLNVNLLGRETFRYTDRDNQPNTDYFYYLQAVDSAGNQSKASDKLYARRVVKDVAANGTIALKVKHNKRKKVNTITWEYEATQAFSGFVVFAGEQESELKPMTGLIKSKNFIDRKDDAAAKKTRYYQVRAYVAGEIVYSEIVKQNFSN